MRTPNVLIRAWLVKRPRCIATVLPGVASYVPSIAAADDIRPASPKQMLQVTAT